MSKDSKFNCVKHLVKICTSLQYIFTVFGHCR